MFNNPKITGPETGVNVKQILANVEFQMSVGCRVPKTLGTVNADTGKTIALAGTPIQVDFSDLTKEVAATDPNAVLLHDVDVTAGTANGTALYFGVVNINRLDETVQAKVTAGVNTVGAVSFLKA